MDDTIENLCEVWVDYLNEKHNLSVSIDEITDWDITKSFPTLSIKEVYAPLMDEKLWDRVDPLPDAVEFLKRLIDDGHDVLIVTASNPNMINVKLNKVLFKYFPFIPNYDVIITGYKDLIDGDVLIDDAPHNFLRERKLNLLMNAPHNKNYDIDKHPYKLIRVKNWCEIYEKINDYLNKECDDIGKRQS